MCAVPPLQPGVALDITHQWQTGITDHVVSPTYMTSYSGRQGDSVALAEWFLTSSISCADSGDALSFRPIETPSTAENTIQQSCNRAHIAPRYASSTRPIAKGEAPSLCFRIAKKGKGYEVWTAFGYATIGFVTCKGSGTINQRAGSIFAVANDLMERKFLRSNSDITIHPSGYSTSYSLSERIEIFLC
jgi:hypothetical protein